MKYDNVDITVNITVKYNTLSYGHDKILTHATISNGGTLDINQIISSVRNINNNAMSQVVSSLIDVQQVQMDEVGEVDEDEKKMNILEGEGGGV